MTENWDSYYREHPVSLPAHPFMPTLTILFTQKGVRRVLDLGCGTGRHLLYLSQQGFDMSGLDSSVEGLRIAEELLAEKRLQADLTVASMFDKLPYVDSYFDAVICCRTLNHGTIRQIRYTISEMKRLLKRHGIIFIEVRKPSLPFRTGQKLGWADEIAPRTRVYRGGSGMDNGIHYQFNKAILFREFSDFRKLKFWVDKQRYYCLLGSVK